MGLTVSLGTTAQVPGFGPARIGQVGLDPCACDRPVAPGRKGHVARLARACEVWARSAAFPAILPGVHGFPADRAAAIAVRTIRAQAWPPVGRVLLVALGAEARRALESALGETD